MTDPLQTAFDDFLARSIAVPGDSRRLHATGIDLHYLEWPGPPGAPPLLLLHGFLAHAHWWDFIAPWLAQEYRVIAPDFGGMGDSGHRDSYTHQGFQDEIATVIEHTGIAGCQAVGHSFGGRALLHACRRFGPLISRGIVVDSRLTTPADPMRGFDEEWRPKKRYASEEEILRRFVLRPVEPAPAAALAHMARHSVREEKGAFVWKFDEQITRLFRGGSEITALDDSAELAGLATPIDVVYGELSRVVTADRAAQMRALLPGLRSITVLPATHHHIPVSQPLALLGCLRVLLQLP